MENRVNDQLKDKLSIGLSLSMSIEEYKLLFEKYHDYIHSLYFSPPLKGKYHSRKEIEKEFSDPRNVQKFYKIIEMAKDRGYILDCVLNRPSISESDIRQAIDYIKETEVDQITCLSKDVASLHEAFPDKELIYSYNNDLSPRRIETIPPEFSTVVVGKYFLRSPELLKQVVDKGFKLKLLVNNGCSFNCKGCQAGSKQCQETFEANLKKHGINYLYALQSFYPTELEALLSMINLPIESIKISNRTDGYEYLDKCLDSYINLVDPQTYIDEKKSNFRLWSRMAGFNPYFETLDNNEIVKIKQKGFNK